MEDINNVTVVGRLTRDSELNHTQGGAVVVKMGIAVNRSVKRGDQWTEEANFFDVTLWGKRGESLSKYLTRGTRIAVTGQLQQDRWEQDGQKRSRVFINALSIQLLGGNKDGHNNQGNDGYIDNINKKFNDDIPY